MQEYTIPSIFISILFCTVQLSTFCTVQLCNCDYRRKIKNRKKNVANIHTYCIKLQKKKFLHDTVYFLSIFPEELHHVANTYCIKPQKKWLLRNLPSKYLQILSTADFVSMWRRITGTRNQILYFNSLYTEMVRGQWLQHKYHSYFFKSKRRIPFDRFKGVFY